MREHTRRGGAKGAATRRRRPLVVLGLCVGSLLAGLGMWDAMAQPQPPAQNERPPLAPNANPQEKEALDLYDKNEPLTARTKAEEILKQNPDSIYALYVLGRVMHEAEGTLPMAMAKLGRARELYEKQYPVTARPANAPWRFHQELLYAIAGLAQEMEEFDYQLQVLDFHDSLYSPMAVGEHAWPLMRLGRLDEARSYARKAADGRNAWQRSLGLNSLCAIEEKAQTRDPYFKACLAALENIRKEEASLPAIDASHQSHLAVHAYNATLGALAALSPDEAEKIALEGTKKLSFTPANPWRLLVQLYANQGRVSDAIGALREMQSWRRRQPPNVRAQDSAENDAAVATVFLLAAEAERGLRLIDRAIEQPDRRGLSSSTSEQAIGGQALLRRALRRTWRELEAERAVYAGSTTPGIFGRLGSGLERWANDFADEERIISVMTDSDILLSTFRPYLSGGLDGVPIWLVGDLVDVLGAGVVAVVLRDVRQVDAQPTLAPYFDALECEVAMAQGDETRALGLAQQALDRLPKSEALLKARIAAHGFRAAQSEGKTDLAKSMLEQAMQLDPSVFRRLGLKIPARLGTMPAGDVGERVGDMLSSSPRLDIASGGITIQAESDRAGVALCTYGPSGTRLSCVRPDPPREGDKPPTAEEQAQKLVEAFHRRALAVPLGLSGTDLSSLDGTTTVGQQAVNKELDGVLE
ncbi:MAG: hypothetical protein IT373_27990 [Polyangiaceae bacterium]|nr:hypothetical protein [Polyangiaceae bacterium]